MTKRDQKEPSTDFPADGPTSVSGGGTAESASALLLRNLVRRHGNQVVLDGLNLEVPAGAHLCIRGPSGCGKTTLLRAIAGLDVPDDGVVSIQGRVVSGIGIWVPPHMRELGFVFQTPALWPHMTVAQNIRFGLQALKMREANERVEQLLVRFALQDLRDRHPDEISGGEARRVSIARSMAPRPALLLLDEPMTHLDDALKDRALDFLLEEAAETGTSLLLVTHDADEARRISSCSLMFREGEWALEK